MRRKVFYLSDEERRLLVDALKDYLRELKKEVAEIPGKSPELCSRFDSAVQQLDQLIYLFKVEEPSQ